MQRCFPRWPPTAARTRGLHSGSALATLQQQRGAAWRAHMVAAGLRLPSSQREQQLPPPHQHTLCRSTAPRCCARACLRHTTHTMCSACLWAGPCWQTLCSLSARCWVRPAGRACLLAAAGDSWRRTGLRADPGVPPEQPTLHRLPCRCAVPHARRCWRGGQPAARPGAAVQEEGEEQGFPCPLHRLCPLCARLLLAIALQSTTDTLSPMLLLAIALQSTADTLPPMLLLCRPLVAGQLPAAPDRAA